MRYSALLVVLFFSQVAFTQVQGNKNILTKTFPLSNLQEIEVNLHAEIEVNASASTEYLAITCDANLLPYISQDISNGKLVFGQKKWIEPSTDIVIKIGAPKIKKIVQSAHDNTIIKNLDCASFTAIALVGKIYLQGKADQLHANVKVGSIDASTLTSEQVDVNIEGWGEIQLGYPSIINGDVKEDGSLIYKGNPEMNVRSANEIMMKSDISQRSSKYTQARYIDFKIRNNSFRRLNLFVQGPKPDGQSFSYGFPMSPGGTRAKNWTIGSKVYRITKLGVRKLLLEVTAADEGKVVTLFANKN